MALSDEQKKRIEEEEFRKVARQRDLEDTQVSAKLDAKVQMDKNVRSDNARRLFIFAFGFLLTAIVLQFCFLLFMCFVVPKFQQIFLDLKIELPGFTLWLLKTSEWLIGIQYEQTVPGWIFVVPFVAVLGLGLGVVVLMGILDRMPRLLQRYFGPGLANTIAVTAFPRHGSLVDVRGYGFVHAISNHDSGRLNGMNMSPPPSP